MSACSVIEGLEGRLMLAATPQVKVLTQNLYYGGAFNGIFEGGSGLLPSFDSVRETNFPERAQALAKMIRRGQPHLIGLQEAVIWRTGRVFDSNDADRVEYDFTQILLEALNQGRGPRYAVVSRSVNHDIEVPARVDGRLRDLRMTDQDVILARTDLPASQFRVFNPHDGRYTANFDFSIPLIGDFAMTRGWASVDVRLRGQTFRFITTHLEAFDSGVRVEQARELAAGPARTRLPTIVAGDFNSGPGYQASAYSALTRAGFADAWVQSDAEGAGLTCCQDSDLKNSESELAARIDLVLVRSNRLQGVSSVLIGEEQRDRTRSGLWPSDHAGVFSVVRVRG